MGYAGSVIPKLLKCLWNDVDGQNARLGLLSLAATEIAGDNSRGEYRVYIVRLRISESIASIIEDKNRLKSSPYRQSRSMKSTHTLTSLG